MADGDSRDDREAAARPRWTVAPYFFVEDVVAAADYYRDRLGFQYDRLWGEPPTFCMVSRQGVTIMLAQCAGGVRPNRVADPAGDAWDAYLWVDDADALRHEFAGRGVTIVRDLCDQHYGVRDFEVEDRDGYRLCFGHSLGE